MTELHYQTWGPRDGAPIVLLHGFMGRGGDWRFLADAMPGYRFVAVDAPGHGGSVGLPGDVYSMEGATNLLERVLDAERIEEAALVGYSMGGRWALHVGLRHPDRLRRLALVSASPGLADADARAARRKSDAERASALREDLGGFLDAWYQMPLWKSLGRHPELVARWTVERRLNDPEELARSLAGMGTGRQDSLWERLGGLRVDTLAVVGALDAKYTALAERMAACSPRIRAAVVDAAGHAVHAERPAAFSDLLQLFLKPNAL